MVFAPASSTAPSLRHRPKASAVCGELEALAREIGPDSKLPTVVELRRRLGAGTGTLEAALCELESRGVLVRKRGIGIFSAPAVPVHIALVCNASVLRGATPSPFWDLILEQAQGCAGQHNQKLSLHLTLPRSPAGELQGELLRSLENGSIQGLIGIGLSQNSAAFIESCGVPYVAFAGVGRAIVAVDSDEATRGCARALLARGCERIGFWSSIEKFSSHSPPDEREREQAKALASRVSQQLGIEFDAGLVQDNSALWNVESARLPSLQEQGYNTAHRVFGATASETRPDGVVIGNDMMAHGALAALQELGITPGRDVHIAAHTNKGSSALMSHEKRLIRLEFDPAEVAATIFTGLEAQMNPISNASSPHISWVQPRLILPP